MAEEVSERPGTENEDPNEPNGPNEQQGLIYPIYYRFREGREQQEIGRCPRILLRVLKGSFSLLGLWGHQCWNYLPCILFMVISFYQVVYRMYIDCGCPNFDCHSKPNLISNKTLHGVVATGNVVFTIVSFAAVISYIFFVGSFYTASRLNSALVSPSETLMEDISKSDAWLLFLTYVLIIVLFLGLGASLYTLPKTSEIRDPHYTIAVITGTGAQLLVHLGSINTCQVFAVSSLAIGTFAQDVTRKIRGIQGGSIDDVINIHEDLCTVVFNTVSAYSAWFVVHWVTYGAGVVIALIYISEEIKFDTTATEFAFVGLLLFCCFYLFVFPCYFAASITSSCAGIYEEINRTTGWEVGPFSERSNVALFISYAKDRGCGFKVGRITFTTSLAWFSFFFGLTGLLYHFIQN